MQHNRLAYRTERVQKRELCIIKCEELYKVLKLEWLSVMLNKLQWVRRGEKGGGAGSRRNEAAGFWEKLTMFKDRV